MTIRFHIDEVSTVVQTRNMDITVEPREIWPIPARGSKYNIHYTDQYVDHSTGEPRVKEGPDDQIRRISMKRLDEFSPGPEVTDETVELISEVRVWRNGPVIITPHGEALVWKKVDDGTSWNPYYVGKVNIDPIWHQYPMVKGGHPGVNGLFPTPESVECSWFTPKQLGLWTGCMFKTGEPWTVRARAGRNNPVLTWPGSMGKSGPGVPIALGTEPIHPELIEAYREVRPIGGMLYVMMGGHIWINSRKENISDDEVWDKVSANMQRVLKELSSGANHPLLQMFNARMDATRPEGKPPSEGCLPIYLGNCSDFDGGAIPVTNVGAVYARQRPVIHSPDKIEGDGNDEQFIYDKNRTIGLRN